MVTTLSTVYQVPLGSVCRSGSFWQNQFPNTAMVRVLLRKQKDGSAHHFRVRRDHLVTSDERWVILAVF
eukprot:scaffold922_cov156-Amphora_coffeaeformis.AAC.6